MPQGDISPITPKQSPSENIEVDSPPRPPSAYTPPPRPAEGFTPPLPPTQILGLGASPPKAPTALQPPPPPPAASDSGGEASMSSISDTDLGEVSSQFLLIYWEYMELFISGVTSATTAEYS